MWLGMLVVMILIVVMLAIEEKVRGRMWLGTKGYKDIQHICLKYLICLKKINGKQTHNDKRDEPFMMNTNQWIEMIDGSEK